MTGRKKEVSWDIGTACNYSCSYCFLHGAAPAPATPGTLVLSPEKWGDAWSRFRARFGPARVHVSGGEPFLYPGFTEILRRLSAEHEVYVITNFSRDLSGLIELVPPESVRLVLSLHPEHVTDSGEFLGRAAALKEQGFTVRVTAVGYPPFLGKLAGYAARCAQLGLKFVATPFFGVWNGRQYPGAYEPAQKALLAALLDKPRHGLYQFQEVSTLGLSCRAGMDYCRIGPDGEVKTCLNGSPMGSFLSPGFALAPAPLKCASAYCHCMPEFACCELNEE